MAVVLGIDIGGSHITTALIDLHSGTIMEGSKKRKFVDSQASAEQICKEWCEVINATGSANAMAIKEIGIAMPGPFDYQEGISLITDQDKFKALYGLNLKKILAARLSIEADNIRFINDAASFLQGEVFGGAAKNYNRVLGLTLGTGLGSAHYIDGVAWDADLWHSPFKEGIAEDYLSTRWFVSRYQALSGKTVAGVKELLEEGNPSDVSQVFNEFSDNLSLFILPFIKKYSFEAIVFGGNIANADSYFFPALKQHLIDNNLQVQLYKSTLNEDASLIGAASCWSKVESKLITP